MIEDVAGYGLFSTFGIKRFFAGGGKGKWMVVTSRFMRRILPAPGWWNW